jgi:DNA (cytosine-5)-methyltransferase 1
MAYALNFPDTPVLHDDIRDLDPVECINRFGIEQGQLDVLDGSPPCASYSTSGKREKLWGKVKAYSDRSQRTDDLVEVFADWIVSIRPRSFVFENVKGISSGKASGVLRDFIGRLREAGYVVDSRVVDASLLGVPQARPRVFTVGIRSDCQKASFAFPRPDRRRPSISDAFGGAERLTPVEAECWSTGYAVEPEWRKAGEGGKSRRFFNLMRAHRHRPCPTITATHAQRGAASVMHPTECRKFSIAELRRLCSFPDDFRVVGTYQQQAERFGRAVPPLAMKSIAEAVAESLKGARS